MRGPLPAQASSHNLTLSPLPTFHPIVVWNQPTFSPSPQLLDKSLHHHD